MAEKKPKEKQEKPESPPTERVLLAGFEMSPKAIAKALVEGGWGQTPNDPALDDKRRGQLTADVMKLIADAKDLDKRIVAYVEIEDITGTDQRKAIEASIGANTLGIYRAPSERAWKGGVAKRPPKDIPADVETLD